MRTLKIMDYDSKVVDTGLELNLDKIERIDIRVLSGDEVATVTFTNGKRKKFDSSDCRMVDFHDADYTIYSKSEGINLLDGRDSWKVGGNAYEDEDFDEESISA